MPPVKKVDLLPAEQRDWLKQALKKGGFSGYEQIADDLNDRLEEGGYSLRIHRASVQRYGQGYKQFVKYQEESSAWAQGWMNDEGLEDEAARHGVLFQMLTTLAFKVMQKRMDDAEEIDPKDLHFLGKMLKDVMASSGLREKMLEEDRKRISREVREAVTKKFDQALEAGDIDKEAAQKAREIMGFG